MRMKVARKRNAAGSVSLAMEGEFNIYTVRKLKDLLDEELTGSAGVTLDLAEVTCFDSAGYQLLEYAGREALRRNKSLDLLEISSAVSKLYSLYGKKR